MARRASSVQTPSKANLSIEQLKRAVPKLKRRIADVENFDPDAVRPDNPSADTLTLEKSIEDTLLQIFGSETKEYINYRNASVFDWPMNIYSETPIGEIRKSLKECKERSLAILKSALLSIEEQIEDSGLNIKAAPSLEKSRLSGDNKRVFIVHGHDDGPREALARLLEKIGLEPIILHDQPNKGATIIEKFERSADVDFAIVILTPDDEGSVKDGAHQPRARQNVILELGYFVGRLGRDRVCALKSGNLELPSDIVGVVWTDFDAAGGWKTAIGKELQAAGYDVDWNKLMRP